MIRCRNCREPFSISVFPYRCPSCGGLFGFLGGLPFSPETIAPDLPGIWKYRAGFGLPDSAPVVSLGEGNTPLVRLERAGGEVWLKLESLNPTGSFKDRGTAVLASWLLEAEIARAVEDSSGNAGASFAAYAGRAGLQATIFIPADASGPKRAQIERFGSEVVSVPGPRSEAARAVLREADRGAAYASHAYLPHGTAGIATIAYELIEQLGRAPGTVVLPVGHGSLLLGISLGFEALLESGVVAARPRLVGVQSAACDPLTRADRAGLQSPGPVQERKTIADGVAIATPYHGVEVLSAVRRSGGTFLSIGEDRILQAQAELARLGFDVEATAALAWAALAELPPVAPGPVVSILTGHGLKGG